MGNLNKALLIGRLGQEPEKRVTAQGASVVTLNLATTEKYKDKTGIQQERTEWHRVIFWNQQAEVIEKYCRKGSQLYIEGRIQTREWQDKDGNKRWTTEIVGQNFQFLDPANYQGGNQDGNYQNNPGSGFQNNPGGSSPNNPGGSFQSNPGGEFQNNSGAVQQNSGGQQFASAAGSGFQTVPNNQTAGKNQQQDEFVEDDIPF
jgi:single-strand DNA-binding protein